MSSRISMSSNSRTEQHGQHGQIQHGPPSLRLRISNVLSYAAFIVVNVLASLNVFGPSNAEVSRKLHTPLTPSGWAFSIWGLIYMLQGAGVIYAAVPAGYQMHWKKAAVNAVGYGWQLSWLFEAAWLIIFPQQTSWSFCLCALLLFVALATMWASLRQLYLLVQPAGGPGVVTNPLMYLLYLLPSSLNAAWLSVASCLGLTVLAASQGVPEWQQRALAAVLAVAVSTAAAAVVLHNMDVAYGLTLIWALTAIIQAHQHVPVVRFLSIVAVAVLLIACGFVVAQQYRAGRGWDNSSRYAAAMATAAAAEDAAAMHQTLLHPAAQSPA
eukprot:gene4486-biopygen6228